MEALKHSAEQLFLHRINSDIIEGVSLSQYVGDLNDLYFWLMEQQIQAEKLDKLSDLREKGKITDSEYIKVIESLGIPPLTEKYILDLFYSLKECSRTINMVAIYKQEIQSINFSTKRAENRKIKFIV